MNEETFFCSFGVVEGTRVKLTASSFVQQCPPSDPPSPSRHSLWPPAPSRTPFPSLSPSKSIPSREGKCCCALSFPAHRRPRCPLDSYRLDPGVVTRADALLLNSVIVARDSADTQFNQPPAIKRENADSSFNRPPAHKRENADQEFNRPPAHKRAEQEFNQPPAHKRENADSSFNRPPAHKRENADQEFNRPPAHKRAEQEFNQPPAHKQVRLPQIPPDVLLADSLLLPATHSSRTGVQPTPCP